MESEKREENRGLEEIEKLVTRRGVGGGGVSRRRTESLFVFFFSTISQIQTNIPTNVSMDTQV